MRVSQRRMEQLYEKRKVIIRKLVSKFHSMYGGDWDELHAEANFFFVKAVTRWVPKRGPLNRYMTSTIWGGLLELRRTKATRAVKKPNIQIPKTTYYYQSWFFDLVDEASRDAKNIIKCVLEPPLDLYALITDREGFRIVQRALREYFANSWPVDRLSDAFANIEEILISNQEVTYAQNTETTEINLDCGTTQKDIGPFE